MTPNEREARAMRIRGMLQDGELNNAFNEVEQDLLSSWRTCTDPAERENLWRAQHGLSLVRQKLASWGHGDAAAIRRVK